MMTRWRKRISVIGFIGLMVYSAWCVHRGDFIMPEESLLMVMRFPTEEEKIQFENAIDSAEVVSIGKRIGRIYSINIDCKQEAVKKKLEVSQYSEMQFPYRQENDLICAAKNLKTNAYVVLKISSDGIEEVMKSQRPIYYPRIIRNGTAIVFEQEVNQEKWTDEKDKRYQNLIYVCKTGEIREIVIGEISKEKTAFSESRSGAVLYSENGKIKVFESNGNIGELSEGLFPIWEEEEKTILYYDKMERQILRYDLIACKKVPIIKDVELHSPFSISSNKKYIAAFVTEDNEPLGNRAKFGERVSVKVFSLNGWIRRDVSIYRSSWLDNIDGGISWDKSREE